MKKSLNDIKDNKENKKIIFKDKRLVTVIILLIALMLLIPIGYALFSDVKEDKANVRVGEIKVTLKEDWPKNDGDPNPDNPDEIYDEFGIEKYTKRVWGHSVAEQDAYVRIRCIPIVQYYKPSENEGDGEWITAPISQSDIILAINTEDWVQQGDYWYYTKILKGYEDTSEINIDWQVAEIPSEISTYSIRTDVRVILEYAQTTNNMWKDIFQIEDLPAEVERVQE